MINNTFDVIQISSNWTGNEKAQGRLTVPSSNISIVVFCDEPAWSFELVVLSHEEFFDDDDVFDRKIKASRKQIAINIAARKTMRKNVKINIKLVFFILKFVDIIVSFIE